MVVRKKNDAGRIRDEYVEQYREPVSKMAKLGCTDAEISDVIGISEDSLQKKWRYELTEGRGNLKAAIRKAQVEAAIVDKNPTMLIWLGKCYLKQREPKAQVEHSGGVSFEKVIFQEEAEQIHAEIIELVEHDKKNG